MTTCVPAAQQLALMGATPVYAGVERATLGWLGRFASTAIDAEVRAEEPAAPCGQF